MNGVYVRQMDSRLGANDDKSQTSSCNWLQPLHNWPNTLIDLLRTQSAVVRVVVANVRGSAPRESGACMLVERDRIHGTIGGGRLEWTAIETARSLLSDSGPAVRIEKSVLGPDLGQCCGGVVELWIERYTRADLRTLESIARAMQRGGSVLVSTLTSGSVVRQVHIVGANAGTRFERDDDEHATLVEVLDEDRATLWLYGAGHVGQALVRVLAELPIRVTWIDSRRECLPVDAPSLALPRRPGEGAERNPSSPGRRGRIEVGASGRLDILHSLEPLETVSSAPSNTHFIVMTHSHPLDYALCRAILDRNDFASVGVIGSKSKAARFRSRLARDGMPPQQIEKLICPLGIQGIKSKLPGVIAVAIAAQVLQTIASASTREDAHDVEMGCGAGAHGQCTACVLPGRTS